MRPFMNFASAVLAIGYTLFSAITLIASPPKVSMRLKNKLLMLDFPPGTKINTGVPNDSPSELLIALSKYFSTNPTVSTVYLGLAEFIPPADKSIFSYIVGIEGHDNLDLVIDDLKKIALSSPMGRWPVIIVPKQKHPNLFTHQAIVVYHRKNRDSQKVK